MSAEQEDLIRLQAEVARLQARLAELEQLESRCQLAESELSRQNEFFRQVLESLTHPFYVIDAQDYTIKIANRAARLGNLSERPTCYQLTHRRDTPCDGVEHLCPLQRVKQTKGPVVVEHTHYDQDGNPRQVEVHAYPILDAQGEVVQLIEYSLDITERKEMAQAIQDYADRIKHFAYSVSHDLKNPLVAIDGLVKLLARRYQDKLDEKGRLICQQICRESEQALTLIEEINVFIRTRETPLYFELLQPKEILNQVREEFLTAINNRGLQWREPAEIPAIRADRMGLLRVFRNLIDNALKYGGEGMQRIEIGYQETETSHIFSVFNDGVGIEEEFLEKMFDTFSRSSRDRDKEGTGLGLAIVREIAEKHQGKAWAQSGAGGGVTFYFSLAKDLQNGPSTSKG